MVVSETYNFIYLGVVFKIRQGLNMSLLLWAITIVVICLCEISGVIAFSSCSQIVEKMNQLDCKCEESESFYNVTCPISGDKSFDVLLKETSFEIDCKNHEIKNVSLIPEVIHERIDKAEYYGFIECPMANFVNVTNKLIQTKHFDRMSLTKMNHMVPSVLKGYRIHKLHILESSLDTLPEQLLYDIEDLKEIFINNNNITKLPENLFKKSKKLQRIDLGQNNLEDIPANLFAELHDLEYLHLFGNKISRIDSNLFRDLYNLKEIELMTNQISEIPVDAFIHLPNLIALSLRSNQFVTFPQELFKNNTQLTTLQFSNNAFLSSLPQYFFANLTMLELVSISNCNLSSIPENIFWGAVNLRKIFLDFNNLTHLKKYLFKDAINLQELYLRNNALETVEADIFAKSTNLIILNLINNKLKIQDNTFAGLKNLQKLYLSYNLLSDLTKASFKHFQNLTLLDMSHNNLTLETPHFKGQDSCILPYLNNLEYLYLQDNVISYIFSAWAISYPRLKEINLEYNNIKSLDYSKLQFLQDHQVTVNLKHNKINTIDLSTIESLFDANKNSKHLEKRIISLNGNPINCDCNIYDLVRYVDGTMNKRVRDVIQLDLNDLMCQTPSRYMGRSVLSLQSQSLTCILDDGPKLPTKCHEDVTQHYQFRQSNNRLIMNCSYKGLTELPPIDINPTTMYTNLSIEVTLHGNNITSLSRPVKGYENVVELDLSYNNITEVNWIPPNTKVLKLHNNNLSYLNAQILDMLNETTITNLTVHNNPWRCDCNLINFTKYLQENFKKVSNLHEITCEGDVRRELTRLSLEELCPNIQHFITLICALLAVCALLIAVAVAFYFRYKQQIKVWMYAHNMCLFCVTEDELDQDKLFDAFISFSHEDEDFVVGELLPGLEQGPRPFRLCVHFRDWLPGEFITKNIARSIEESRRTVVVLSHGFLRSEWGRMEFRTAHTEALKEGRARVIVIVYGDIGPVDELDSELRAYLSTNTYIKWGTPWFWDNLRYALPHYSKNLKYAAKLPQKMTHQLDKTDLIKEPCTPPAASTPPADAARHLNDPLLHNALNVALIDGALINNASTKHQANNNHIHSMV